MWRLRFRRWLAGRQSHVADELRDYWRSPLPRLSSPVSSLELLVCDGEMSGLDPGQAELLSLGWLVIRGSEQCLGSAEHHLIRAEHSVGMSATVHQLRDCELADARELKDVLRSFLAAARGRVLVFHHAPIDTAFLNAAALRVFGAPLLLPVIDTLALEQRLLRRRDAVVAPGALRLRACRERYGLPTYAAHNALTDAVATGELLLAHIARRGHDLRLRDLV